MKRRKATPGDSSVTGGRFCAGVWRDERGVIAIIAALMLTAMIGMAAWAIDLGWFFVVRSELQNAADSGALAGVVDLVLQGQTEAREVAIGYATQPTNYRITKPTPGNGAVRVSFPGTDRVQVRVGPVPVSTIFARVWGIETVNVAAVAVAEMEHKVIGAGPGNVLPFGVHRDLVVEHGDDGDHESEHHDSGDDDSSSHDSGDDGSSSHDSESSYSGGSEHNDSGNDDSSSHHADSSDSGGSEHHDSGNDGSSSHDSESSDSGGSEHHDSGNDDSSSHHADSSDSGDSEHHDSGGHHADNSDSDHHDGDHHGRENHYDIGATVDIPLDTQSPGNFGILDLDGGSNSNSDTSDWVANGYDGVFVIPEGTGFINVEGSPGITGNSLSGVIRGRIDDRVLFPVFDRVTGEGANGSFHVVGLVGVIIRSFQLTGAASERHLTVEIVEFTSNNLITSDSDAVPPNNSLSAPVLIQ